jgi:hypothetical protein
MKILPSLALTAALLGAPAFAQQPAATPAPPDSMQVLREKVSVDKKAFVAANMELTEAEAKAFWPLYEAYQKDLQRANEELATVIVAYSKEYNAKSLTDAKAVQLLKAAAASEEAYTKRLKLAIDRFGKVLPGRKLARYIQLETKIRAAVRYEIAAEVPLAP